MKNNILGIFIFFLIVFSIAILTYTSNEPSLKTITLKDNREESYIICLEGYT